MSTKVTVNFLFDNMLFGIFFQFILYAGPTLRTCAAVSGGMGEKAENYSADVL